MSVTEHGTESLLHAVICQWQKNTWQRTDWLKQPTCCSCKQRSSVEIVKCRLGGLNYLLHTQTYTNTMFLTGDVMYIYIYIYIYTGQNHLLHARHRRQENTKWTGRGQVAHVTNKKQKTKQTADSVCDKSSLDGLTSWLHVQLTPYLWRVIETCRMSCRHWNHITRWLTLYLWREVVICLVSCRHWNHLHHAQTYAISMMRDRVL